MLTPITFITFILHVQEAAARLTKALKSAGITTTKKDRNARTTVHAIQVKQMLDYTSVTLLKAEISRGYKNWSIVNSTDTQRCVPILSDMRAKI